MVPHVRLRPVPEGVQSVRSIRDRQEGLLGAVEDSAAGRFHQGHLGVGVGVDSGCCWGYSAVGLGLTLADSSTSGNPISVQVALKVANHPSLTELWVVDIRKEPRLELG